MTTTMSEEEQRDYEQLARERRIAFGANLRRLREAAGLTQTSLGERVGAKQQTVAKWEDGENAPSPDRVYDLETVLLGSVTGELSISLNYVHPSFMGESPPCTLKRALIVDPSVSDRLRRVLNATVDLELPERA